MNKSELTIKLYKIALSTTLDKLKKDLNGNFDVTSDGGIDHPDTEAGFAHALKFADWTGYNQAIKDIQEILKA